MPPLDDPRHERFAQNLAAGMPRKEAFLAAGWDRWNSGSACRLAAKVQARVRELQQAPAEALIQAQSAKAQAKEAIYRKLAETIPNLRVETAHEVATLTNAALALDKDERVTEGGVSDRVERHDSDVSAADRVREIFARHRRSEEDLLQ